MSNKCANCFNGCSDIYSDQCVRYTGPDIPLLGISSGDSLLSVEQAIFSYLVPVLNGEGIVPVIDQDELCAFIKSALGCTTCTELTLNQVLDGLVKAICLLKTSIDSANSALQTLEGPYTIDCLDGVGANDGTHAILQATIIKLCGLITDFEALLLDLSTNYITVDNIDQYIENYINAIPSTSLVNNKMIPFVALPYFGPLTNFDLSGAGTALWTKIYLCNGNNGTPDLRGRGLVGATTMGTGTFDPVVDPGIPGNPNYILNSNFGSNLVPLTVLNMPGHTHNANITITDPGHTHLITTNTSDTGNTARQVQGGTSENPNTSPDQIVSSFTGITADVTIDSEGGTQPHANIQPVKASYFIMYIP